MRLPTLRALTLPCVLAASAIAASDDLFAQDRAVFLLDRSGSMLNGFPTRCDRSQMAAQADISKFHAAHPGSLVSVREFSDSIPGASRFLGLSEWTSSTAVAQAAVDTASPCGGLTALADAICDVSLALQIAGADNCTIYIYADGGENSSGGACSGPSAINAATGCCPFDPYCSDPFSNAPGGGVSWQQSACTLISALSLSCDTVINSYEFGNFPLGAIDPGFQFLESLSRGTGGVTLRVDDVVPQLPATFVRRTGCASSGTFQPILQFQNLPRLGELFTCIHLAPPGYDRYISISAFAQVPPIDLTAISAPGCALGIGPQFSVNSALLPFVIPNNPTLVGEAVHFQGLAFDASLGLNPGWLLTTNTYSLTLAP